MAYVAGQRWPVVRYFCDDGCCHPTATCGGAPHLTAPKKVCDFNGAFAGLRSA
jgi:hypothetical protein